VFHHLIDKHLAIQIANDLMDRHNRSPRLVGLEFDRSATQSAGGLRGLVTLEAMCSYVYRVLIWIIERELNMTVARLVAYFATVFLCGIGLILLIKPELATGPRGLPLLKGESRPMLAVLAAREIVLGLLAGGLAYTGNYQGLLLAFSIALLVIVIDVAALLKTRSIFGFIVNDLVGLMLLFAVLILWRDLGKV